MRRLNNLWDHNHFRLLVMVFIVFIIFMGVVIVPIERNSREKNIHTLSDGIWWSVTTVTSVGYGDTYPVTPLGRTLGMILMISGVALTGIMLGFVTVTLFHSRDEFYWRRISNRLDRLEDQIDKLQKSQNYVVKSVNQADEEEENTDRA